MVKKAEVDTVKKRRQESHWAGNYRYYGEKAEVDTVKKRRQESHWAGNYRY
ncbi:MAG: hypothetical protein K6A23_14240 [Butyrivibrio sp.]|nr:hypothetical protein [Butyrivibrio sp.]